MSAPAIFTDTELDPTVQFVDRTRLLCPGRSSFPELIVRDLDTSRHFWCDLLGFRIVYERPEDGFAYLDCNGAQIMLKERSAGARQWIAAELAAPFGRGVNFQISVTDVDAICAVLAAAHWPLFMAREERWYRADTIDLGVVNASYKIPTGISCAFPRISARARSRTQGPTVARRNRSPMRRRTFIAAAAAGLIFPDPAAAQSPAAHELVALEAHSGGRLGVFAFDTGSARTIAHRAAERFPMCSTFKLLAVSAVLSRVDRGAERLDRQISYGKHDLLSYAPATTMHVRDGSMSVASLCAATIELSDNTAANLLVRELGGPPEVTRFARALGDPSTRLDRYEPSMSAAVPGDPRDTTTPHAMAHDLRVIVTGNTLSTRSRTMLARWLSGCRTGTDRLRAGIPAGWRAGDKTGSGGHGTTNDIAVLYPPGHAPVFVTAYLTGATVSGDERNTVLAHVGRVVSRAFAR